MQTPSAPGPDDIRMKLLFAGTPEFARASLQALIDADFLPLAVLTQPDRPAGRGRIVTASPVKTLAAEHRLPLLQPTSLKDAETVETIAALDADVLIVAAYGLLLPPPLLELPRHGCLNVHASLLPRWRGAAPIQAAILAGDAETGVSLMGMEAGLDTGPVYARQSLSIGEAETAGELHDRLAMLGGEVLVQNLRAIVDGKVTPVAQDGQLASYAGKIRAEDAVLDWRQPAAQLARKVRAYNPVPGASFDLDGERVKCWSAQASLQSHGQPGEITAADETGIEVACGEGALRLKSLQRPGRRRVTAREFTQQFPLTGRRLGQGTR